MRTIYLPALVLMLLISALVPTSAAPGYHINSDKAVQQAIQQYGENNFQFDAVVYQAYLDKNMWRLTIAAHNFLREKPKDPVRECSFAQAYWSSQRPGVSEIVPQAAAKQLHGWFDEAVLDTQDAVKRMPKSIYAHLTYGDYLQYFVMGMQKVPAMLHTYQQAVALAPGSGYAHHQLALGYFGSGDGSAETVKKIVNEAKKAVALDPRLTDSYFWIACVYSWPGQPDYRVSSLYLDKYLQAQPAQAGRLDVLSLRKFLKEKSSS